MLAVTESIAVLKCQGGDFARTELLDRGSYERYEPYDATGAVRV